MVGKSSQVKSSQVKSVLFEILPRRARRDVCVVDYLTRWFDCLETMQYNICIGV